MKIKTNLGQIELTKGPPKDNEGEYLDGFYIAHKPKSGHMLEDYTSFVKIRLDEETQTYKLDDIGQETRYSEELSRYSEWYFSKCIFTLLQRY